MRLNGSGSKALVLSLVLVTAVLAGGGRAILGSCGPFTDFTDAGFCPFVLEIFTLGITTGTSPTTYDPASSVTRLQMAAFLSRTVDGSLKRGSRRAAMDQFWTPQNAAVLGLTTVGTGPAGVRSDGADVWVANSTSGTVSRVRGSDGKLLETWTGATSANGVLVAMGRVFVTGFTTPGRLYMIDPSQAAGAVTTVASNLGNGPNGIAFDGGRIWTANNNSGASVSIVTPGASIPWTVTNAFTPGFENPAGMIYDGTNIWVTDNGANIEKLLKLSTTGAILQSVTVGTGPVAPAFDGGNIWVPNLLSSSVSVVRASTGAVIATLTGNGLVFPLEAAFDGQRVLVTDINSGSSNLTLWKAADLTPLGFFTAGAGTQPNRVCSDGINFWTTLFASNRLARF